MPPFMLTPTLPDITVPTTTASPPEMPTPMPKAALAITVPETFRRLALPTVAPLPLPVPVASTVLPAAMLSVCPPAPTVTPPSSALTSLLKINVLPWTAVRSAAMLMAAPRPPFTSPNTVTSLPSPSTTRPKLPPVTPP